MNLPRERRHLAGGSRSSPAGMPALPGSWPQSGLVRRLALPRLVALGLAGLCVAAGMHAVAQTGMVDTDFKIGSGVSGSFVHAIAVNAEGKILIGGNFSRVQTVARTHFAQLNADGSVDTGFSGTGANSEVLAVAYQPDGKIVIGGLFTRVNNTNSSRVARLLANGSLDPEFNVGTGASGDVRSLALQPDGKIVIGGTFTSYGGVSRNGVARLNADGTLDVDFKPGSGVGGERFVDEVRVLGDGRILIAGDFPTYNGTARAGIARLNPDGSLDAAFDPGAGAKPGDPILGMAVQPDGKILIVGSLTGFNRKPLNNFARLNANGSLDSSFTPGSGTSGGPVNGFLQTVALEADGKILIGGWFDRVNGVARSYLARLLPDGRPDTNWTVRVDGQVRALALQPDQKILVGGDFTRVQTNSSPRIARLLASPPLPARFPRCSWQGEGQFLLQFAGDPARQYTLEVSPDLQTWQPWTNTRCASGIVELADPGATGCTQRFYRATLQ